MNICNCCKVTKSSRCNSEISESLSEPPEIFINSEMNNLIQKVLMDEYIIIETKTNPTTHPVDLSITISQSESEQTNGKPLDKTEIKINNENVIQVSVQHLDTLYNEMDNFFDYYFTQKKPHFWILIIKEGEDLHKNCSINTSLQYLKDHHIPYALAEINPNHIETLSCCDLMKDIIHINKIIDRFEHLEQKFKYYSRDQIITYIKSKNYDINTFMKTKKHILYDLYQEETVMVFIVSEPGIRKCQSFYKLDQTRKTKRIIVKHYL